MNILFVCTDNFTRSVIAEFCMKDYLKKTNNGRVNVASAGIRANSDISRYSKIHFNILGEMGIDTSDFKRMQFDETCFEKFDLIIGMSELHRDYMKQQYYRDILLFNQLFNGQQTPVNIGSPDSVDFIEQMNQLVKYVNDAIPYLLRNIEREITAGQTRQVSTSE
jgi:protein-tyrosine phosphatase